MPLKPDIWTPEGACNTYWHRLNTLESAGRVSLQASESLIWHVHKSIPKAFMYRGCSPSVFHSELITEIPPIQVLIYFHYMMWELEPNKSSYIRLQIKTALQLVETVLVHSAFQSEACRRSIIVKLMWDWCRQKSAVNPAGIKLDRTVLQ